MTASDLDYTCAPIITPMPCHIFNVEKSPEVLKKVFVVVNVLNSALEQHGLSLRPREIGPSKREDGTMYEIILSRYNSSRPVGVGG